VTVTVSVDVGGTFTDAFVVDGERFGTGKARTTSHDLSVGFVEAVERAASNVGLTLRQALERADFVKYSTTVGTNALVERVGPVIGLITTRGQEDTIHLGRSRNWADGLPEETQLDRTRAERPLDLVPRTFRVGVPERVDCFGEIVMPLRRDAVAEKVDELVQKGVQAFAVCLTWSFANPAHELLVRDVIRELYPNIYLGSAPVLLSAEVAPKLDEYRRMVTTVLAAFLATETEQHILDLSDRLGALGHRRPLLLARNIGGVASPSRTTALHLCGAGAVAGLSGARHLAQRYGLGNIVAADVGGTTFDIGLLVEGEERNYDSDPVVDRWRIHLPTLANYSIGAGGGSIAWVTAEGDLRVGPRSAGSVPGPVCYDNGGTEPTVTDADLVLGYLDPDYFLGGRLPLDKRKAERAIRRRIATPLDIDVEEAALRVRRLVDGMMGQEIFKHTALRGHDPRDFTMFAYGGAGPVHACDLAEFADVKGVLTFPFGPEFNAFGAASMGILQSYERSHRVVLFDAVRDHWFDDVDAFNRIIDDLLRTARRDLDDEGLAAADVRFELELDMNYGGQHHTVRHRVRRFPLRGLDDLRRLADDFNETFAEAYGAGAIHPEGGIEIQLFKVTATAAVQPPVLPEYDGEDAVVPEVKGERRCVWSDAGPILTPVYARNALAPGAHLVGPALLDDIDTVVAVAPGWSYTVDGAGTGHLARVGAA
jgi:N-methylhydantoinase A/acetophenone carboxylase